MPGDTRKRYPPELKERAVRVVAEIRSEHDSEWAAMTRVAELLGVGTPETVRKWVRQAQVDAGARPGTTTEDIPPVEAENHYYAHNTAQPSAELSHQYGSGLAGAVQ